jgi:hypothetical protein
MSSHRASCGKEGADMFHAAITTKKALATAIAAVAILTAGISATDAKAGWTYGTCERAQPTMFATSAIKCGFRDTWVNGPVYFKREGFILLEWIPSMNDWVATYGKARLYYSQGGPYQLGPCQYFDYVSKQWYGALSCAF